MGSSVVAAAAFVVAVVSMLPIVMSIAKLVVIGQIAWWLQQY